MLKRLDGYWMSIIAPEFFIQRFSLERLPPGTNVYASISLSQVNTVFGRDSERDPHFAATAFVESWTFYKPDGTESLPQGGGAMFTQNAVAVENCARITFALTGQRVAAIAQINLFTL